MFNFAGNVSFSINIFEGTGNFEICEGGSVAVTGHIAVLNNVDSEQLDSELPVLDIDKNALPLNSGDIYKDLGLRGYDYKGVFRGVKESDNKGEYILNAHVVEGFIKIGFLKIIFLSLILFFNKYILYIFLLYCIVYFFKCSNVRP